jgi:predicted DNA-binding transcriptional regulator AlpA
MDVPFNSREMIVSQSVILSKPLINLELQVMDTKQYITAEEAASLLSMSVNAFRILVYRYGNKIEKRRLGKRRVYFLKSSVLALLQ